MSLARHLAPEDVLSALALGAVLIRARREGRDLATLRARPHPIPDLTGEPVDVIVNAVFVAITAAHTAEWEKGGASSDQMCASCEALIELASRYGDPTGMKWPDAVRRRMADILDEEMARRGEPPAWARPRRDFGAE